MGRCLSKERPASADGHLPADGLLEHRPGHHPGAAGAAGFRAASLQRHGSLGVGSPTLFHVNTSNNYYSQHSMAHHYRELNNSCLCSGFSLWSESVKPTKRRFYTGGFKP